MWATMVMMMMMMTVLWWPGWSTDDEMVRCETILAMVKMKMQTRAVDIHWVMTTMRMDSPVNNAESIDGTLIRRDDP